MIFLSSSVVVGAKFSFCSPAFMVHNCSSCSPTLSFTWLIWLCYSSFFISLVFIPVIFLLFMGDSVSGLLVSLHLCTSCSLDFVVSIFHTPSYSCLWDIFCNTYITIYLLLFLPLSKPFFDLPLSFWIYFGLDGLDCEWVVRFELPRCSNLPHPYE